MNLLRRYIPASLKTHYRQWQRHKQDLQSGVLHLLVKNHVPLSEKFPHSITERQPVFASHLSENKVHNLLLAARKLNGRIIGPGQMFSFWNLVERPIEKNGYKKGRAIVQNRLSEETGGGLCQLSGIIYLLAIRAGLPVIERHAHSLDLYQNEERFAPLGGDATVAWAYKDLRFKNNTNNRFCFHFHIQPSEVSVELLSDQPLPNYPIEFQATPSTSEVKVKTIRHREGEQEVLSEHTYKFWKA